MPFQLLPVAISYVASTALNFFSAQNRHKESQERLRDNHEESLSYQRKRDEDNSKSQKERDSSNEKLALRREEMQITQLKYDYLKNRDSQDFQARQAELTNERQKELEHFRQEFQQMLHAENMSFQRWRFEQEKALQEQLSDFNRETQYLMARYQRETAIAMPEINKIFETWPLKISPSLILTSFHENSPIKVIVAPPSVAFDKFGGGDQTIPKLDKRLAEDLRCFFDQYYPKSSNARPVEFLDGAWESKRFSGGSSIKSLFGMLRSESVLVLESEIDGDDLNFRVGYWSAAQSDYSYAPVISKFKYWDLIHESVIARAKEWKKTRDLLLERGLDPKQRNEFDTYNLELFEEEEALRKDGINTSGFNPRYKIKKEDFEKLNEFLLLTHSLTAGLITDIHYLLSQNTLPILPQYLLKYIEKGATKETIQPIVDCYISMLKGIEHERSFQSSDLALGLAESLSNLEDKSFSKNLVLYSLSARLRAWETSTSNSLHSLLNTVSSENLVLCDQLYFKNLLQILNRIGGEPDCVDMLEEQLKRVEKSEGKQSSDRIRPALSRLNMAQSSLSYWLDSKLIDSFAIELDKIYDWSEGSKLVREIQRKRLDKEWQSYPVRRKLIDFVVYLFEKNDRDNISEQLRCELAEEDSILAADAVLQVSAELKYYGITNGNNKFFSI